MLDRVLNCVPCGPVAHSHSPRVHVCLRFVLPISLPQNVTDALFRGNRARLLFWTKYLNRDDYVTARFARCAFVDNFVPGAAAPEQRFLLGSWVSSELWLPLFRLRECLFVDSPMLLQFPPVLDSPHAVFERCAFPRGFRADGVAGPAVVLDDCSFGCLPPATCPDYFVSAARGSDVAAGTAAAPLRSIRQACCGARWLLFCLGLRSFLLMFPSARSMPRSEAVRRLQQNDTQRVLLLGDAPLASSADLNHLVPEGFSLRILSVSPSAFVPRCRCSSFWF